MEQTALKQQQQEQQEQSKAKGKGNERFNAEAASWDSNPSVQAASAKAQIAILERFPQLKEQKEKGAREEEGLDVLELGCGTGILTFLLAPYVRHITAIDASSGMIDALSTKLSADNVPKNITPLNIFLENPEDSNLPDPRVGGAGRRKYDLIISHLVLHHIADLKSTIKMLRGCLKPGTGWLALTDYEDFGPQARRFHPESKMEGVERHGIAKSDMLALFEEQGLKDVNVEVAFELEKQVERWAGEWDKSGGKPATIAATGDGAGGKETREMMSFPFLICMGRRPEGM